MELIAPIRNMLEEVKDEEEEAFGNMPEGLQVSEKGEAVENNVSELEDVLSSTDTQKNTITGMKPKSNYSIPAKNTLSQHDRPYKIKNQLPRMRV